MSATDMVETKQIEHRLIQAIAQGRSRCGLGFGKYPLGVLDVVKIFLPLADTQAVRERLADFENRLNQP